MSKPKQGKKEKLGEGGLKIADTSEQAFAAEVVEVAGKISSKQGGMQVRCKILEGRDTDKVMRRNVQGPVRIGDILMLKQTEIEAQAPRGGRR